MTDYVQLGDKLTIDWIVEELDDAGNVVTTNVDPWPAKVTGIISNTECKVTYEARHSSKATTERVELLAGGQKLKDEDTVREWRKASAPPEHSRELKASPAVAHTQEQTQKSNVKTEQQVQKPKRKTSKAGGAKSTAGGGAKGGGSASAQEPNGGKQVHHTSSK
jgi:hypothetical protein